MMHSAALAVVTQRRLKFAVIVTVKMARKLTATGEDIAFFTLCSHAKSLRCDA